MGGRRWFIFLLVLGLSSLRGLAFASPPDPLWVPGLYDDADHDDIVLVCLALDALPDDPVAVLDGSVRVVGLVVVPARQARSAAPRAAEDSRAPPTS